MAYITLQQYADESPQARVVTAESGDEAVASARELARVLTEAANEIAATLMAQEGEAG